MTGRNFPGLGVGAVPGQRRQPPSSCLRKRVSPASHMVAVHNRFGDGSLSDANQKGGPSPDWPVVRLSMPLGYGTATPFIFVLI